MSDDRDFKLLIIEDVTIYEDIPFDLDGLVLRLWMRLAETRDLPPPEYVYRFVRTQQQGLLALRTWVSRLVMELVDGGRLGISVGPDGVHLRRVTSIEIAEWTN